MFYQRSMQLWLIHCHRLAQTWSKMSVNVRSYSFWAPRTTTKTKVVAINVDQASAVHPDIKHKYNDLPAVTEDEVIVPPVMHRPKELYISSLPNFDKNSCEFVVFDLETTSLKNTSEICQIAATRVSDGAMWSRYILPAGSIDPGASLVTGLIVKYAGNDRYLTHYGNYIKSLPYKEGVWAFYNYLRELSRKSKHVILIGYYSKFFDVPILCNSFHKFGISGENLDRLGISFIDSASILKRLIQKRHASQVDTAQLGTNLSDVYECLFGENFKAHNAVTDVKALTRILFNSPLEITPDSLVSLATTAGSAFTGMEYSAKKAKLLQSMNGRLYSELPGIKLSITKYIAGKIAASGLGYQDLERVYECRGRKGIAQVCQMPVYSDDGKVGCRVTSNTVIINAIAQHFRENT